MITRAILCGAYGHSYQVITRERTRFFESRNGVLGDSFRELYKVYKCARCNHNYEERSE